MICVILQNNRIGDQIHCPQKVLQVYSVTLVTSEDLTTICVHVTDHMFLLAPMADTGSEWRHGGGVFRFSRQVAEEKTAPPNPGVQVEKTKH